MASLKLDDKIAESLRTRAAQQGITVDELLQHLLKQEPVVKKRQARLSAEEFDRLIDEEATDTPGLPEDFSRADAH